MDWDSNTSSAWDALSKLELQDSNYHQHLAAFASSSGSGTVMDNMFSVDLKLGRLEDMRDLSMDTLKNTSGTLTMGSSPYSSSQAQVTLKRGRARGPAQATVSCSVDGCTSDLSQCREYHRRHRVCERHSKTPVVLIGGKERRFCQQCSRFHCLGEFDEVKRSCRKRLDGHNRRRRKTQPETFYMNSGSLHARHSGKGLLQFRSPEMHTANWPMISQPEKVLFYSNHEHLTGLSDSLSWSISCTRADKHFPVLLGFNQQPVHQPFLNDTTTTAGSSRESLKVSPDRLTQSAHSECALSLLSRYPTHSSEICTGPILQPVATSSSAQDIGTALHLNNSYAQFSYTQGPEDESSASLSSTSNNSNAHSFGGFHSGLDMFCANGSSRIFPFTWE